MSTTTIIDQVHGEITLPTYTTEIISSAPFQRLRNLKQLGVAHYIFKKATHSRYEHSIGTAFVAQELLSILEKNSNVQIGVIQKKSVILAALLHDIGHGSFSHLWEDCVREGVDKNWTHEDQSVLMIKYLINKNQIRLDGDQSKHDYSLELICSLITGNKETWARLLKPSEWFLTEIVSNKFCNIDVDKCDYLLRDHHYVELNIEPFTEFLDRARIEPYEDGYTHIAYHADDFHLIENLFANRAKYHHDVYQLPEVAGVERMLKDICLLAEKGDFKMSGRRITEIQQDCEAYTKLDDSILDLIRAERTLTNEAMLKAKKLVDHLDKGEFYTNVYENTDKNEADVVHVRLEQKFGKGTFCKVKKLIPFASVPENIPLYGGANGCLVKKLSKRNLEYESTIIFCTTFDSITINNALNDLKNNNH